jgi:hypothetical protein
MLIQSIIFVGSTRRHAGAERHRLAGGWVLYGALGAGLSWTFTTLAVAAKNVMASVPDYLVIETAFTAVQWIIVAPLTAPALPPLPDQSIRCVRRPESLKQFDAFFGGRKVGSRITEPET